MVGATDLRSPAGTRATTLSDSAHIQPPPPACVLHLFIHTLAYIEDGLVDIIRSIVYASVPRYAVTGGKHGHTFSNDLVVWDLAAKEKVRVCSAAFWKDARGYLDLALSPEGTRAYAVHGSRAYGCEILACWDLRTAKVLWKRASPHGRGQSVKTVTVSADGRRVFSGPWRCTPAQTTYADSPMCHDADTGATLWVGSSAAHAGRRALPTHDQGRPRGVDAMVCSRGAGKELVAAVEAARVGTRHDIQVRHVRLHGCTCTHSHAAPRHRDACVRAYVRACHTRKCRACERDHVPGTRMRVCTVHGLVRSPDVCFYFILH